MKTRMTVHLQSWTSWRLNITW